MSQMTVDWFRVLWDMVQRGHTLQDVADRTGIGRTTLHHYLSGGQPQHWRGELLISHWCEVVGSERHAVPVTELYLAPRVVHRSAAMCDHSALSEVKL